MQVMDSSNNHGEDYNPEIIRAEIVDEMEPGAPWEWREIRRVRPQRRVRLPILLFIATCLSTLLTGGLWYALPVMTILICHEMGHFIQAHRYGVYASLPYFIPIPPPVSPFGTLGAVIVMEPRMGHRKALFDIGITGPLAGLVPTFIFLIVGLHYSSFDISQHDTVQFGYPLLLQFLAKWILGSTPQGCEIAMHPMAFAGWVGLFVTSLNLMPIGQLDGGHVLYALLRQKANRVASLLLLFAFFMVVFNFDEFGGWLPMLFLLFFVFGHVHPPTADDEEPLGRFRTVLGWLTLAFIVIGFTPTPLKFS
jgi:membrane-associated protease RseP (regulator of RpoE activity)